MRIFLKKKNCKNRFSVWSKNCLGAPRPPAKLLLSNITTLSNSFLALNAFYYPQKEQNSCNKCFSFSSSALLHLFFASISIVFVDRGEGGKNVSLLNTYLLNTLPQINSEYTALLTDDPVQRASLLQAVEEHRHKFPDFLKSALAKSLSNFQIDFLQFLRCLTSSKSFVIHYFLVLLNVLLHFSYVFNLTIHYWWLLVKAHLSLSSSALYYNVMSKHFGIRK